MIAGGGSRSHRPGAIIHHVREDEVALAKSSFEVVTFLCLANVRE